MGTAVEKQELSEAGQPRIPALCTICLLTAVGQQVPEHTWKRHLGILSRPREEARLLPTVFPFPTTATPALPSKRISATGQAVSTPPWVIKQPPHWSPCLLPPQHHKEDTVLGMSFRPDLSCTHLGSSSSFYSSLTGILFSKGPGTLLPQCLCTGSSLLLERSSLTSFMSLLNTPFGRRLTLLPAPSIPNSLVCFFPFSMTIHHLVTH